jgi:hypothetical protein
MRLEPVNSEYITLRLIIVFLSLKKLDSPLISSTYANRYKN